MSRTIKQTLGVENVYKLKILDEEILQFESKCVLLATQF